MRLSRNSYENYILVDYKFGNSQLYDMAKNMNILLGQIKRSMVSKSRRWYSLGALVC